MSGEGSLQKRDMGSYVLALGVKKPCRIRAGRLPEREFREGVYLYIGRAKKNLRGRLARHLRTEKKLFWHIDYLLRYARIERIWCRLDSLDECRLVSEIVEACEDACSPIRGFGASDCRCPSHLLHYHGTVRSLGSIMNQIHCQEVKFDDSE